jgi:hypothetical protein
MRETEFRNLFWLCLLFSFLIHLLVMLTVRVPGTWFAGVDAWKGRRAIVLPSREGGAAGTGREALPPGVLMEIPLEGLPLEILALALRGPRPSPGRLQRSRTGIAGEYFAPQVPLWEDFIDRDRLRLLPPHYYSRLERIRPDTTQHLYTVNELIRRAFLEALLEKEKRERLLAKTPLGEFGVTPGVLHLGPLKIPVPFAPYSSMESRAAVRESREIQSQESGISSREEELETQRQRVLEWKERHGKNPE